jgi:DegV family protein with EDD domain
MIRVVTDSTSDLPPQVARDLGIGVVPVVMEIDGFTRRDGVDLQREQFFAQLPAYRDCKTAAPPATDFIMAYEQQIAQGATEILSIHLGRRYSALCDSARVAAQEMTARGVPVRVIDSGTLAICLGWMAQTAAELARRDASAPDILKAIDAMRQRSIIYAMADTLKYLRRSGRVNALTAGIGDLLQIKLLVDVSNGEINQLDRVRARGRGIQRLIDAAHQLARQRQGVERLAVLHSGGDVIGDVRRVQDSMSSLLPMEQQEMMLITPVIGAHFGPMGVGVALLTRV